MSLRFITVVLIGICMVSLAAGCFFHSDADQGSRVIFFGDSITQLGVKPGGYVTLLQEWAATNKPSTRLVGAGISGHKVTDLINRLDRDVLSQKPSFVVIYIGINDVWHWQLKGLRGTTKDTFALLLKKIVTDIQASGARVVLCTPSVVGEKKNGANQLDADLDAYSEISRGIARETGAVMCDLRKAFRDYIAANNPNDLEKGILTYDRVHLNDTGNKFVANEMIKILEKMF